MEEPKLLELFSSDEFVAIKEFNPDSNVRAEKDKVLITASVERFTEGSVDVPIKVLNIPEGKHRNIFDEASDKLTREHEQYSRLLSEMEEINS